MVISVMYFERFRVKKLEDYFKSKGIPVEPMKLRELRVSKITEMLEGFSLIDQRTRSLMDEARRERNEIVHEIANPDTIDKGKAKKMIEKAIECLQALRAA